MKLITLSGLVDKESRIPVAEKILRKRINSFTELSVEEIKILHDALRNWTIIQHERFSNGSSLREACAFWDMISDKQRIVMNERNIIPDEKNRKEISMTDMEVDKEVKALKEKYEVKNASDFVSKIKLRSADAPKMSSPGRWDRWRLIESPSVAMGLSIGVGGIPRGKVLQMWGKNHAGKSMMAQLISAAALKQGIPVFYFDAESSIEADFARHLGLDVNDPNFNLVRPKKMEDMAMDMRSLADSGAVVVIDSIAGSESEKEFERQIDKKAAMVGGNANVIKSTMNIIRPTIVESGTTLIIINQARSKFNPGMYEDPDKAYGPEALFHNSDVIYKVEAASEATPKLKEKGYLNTIFRPKKNRLGEKVPLRLAFKPGFPYNKSLDLLRVCSNALGKDSEGNVITYQEAAGNPICTDTVTETTGSRDIEAKQSRYSIKVDSLMLSAILKDEPDFDAEPFSDFGIEPNEEMLRIFLDTGDAGSEESYTDEEAKWGWFSIPRRGEGAAFTWLQKHPTARGVIVDRLYNALNHKHELMNEE